ncbi:MAG: helix-turn-helix domain-containing protein [Culicoidibacterales bacterium]
MTKDNMKTYYLYKKIIEIQVRKLNITYNVEDFIQEGWLAIIAAEQKFDEAKCPVEHKNAYLTKKVNWHLRTLLRKTQKIQFSEREYRNYVSCYNEAETSNELYWREITDLRWQLIIKMLSQGYSKAEVAEALGVNSRTIQRYCCYLRDNDPIT